MVPMVVHSTETSPSRTLNCTNYAQTTTKNAVDRDLVSGGAVSMQNKWGAAWYWWTLSRLITRDFVGSSTVDKTNVDGMEHLETEKKGLEFWKKDLDLDLKNLYTNRGPKKGQPPKANLWICIKKLELPGQELEEISRNYPEKEHVDSGKEGCKKNWWNYVCCGKAMVKKNESQNKKKIQTNAK